MRKKLCSAYKRGTQKRSNTYDRHCRKTLATYSCFQCQTAALIPHQAIALCQATRRRDAAPLGSALRASMAAIVHAARPPLEPQTAAARTQLAAATHRARRWAGLRPSHGTADAGWSPAPQMAARGAIRCGYRTPPGVCNRQKKRNGAVRVAFQAAAQRRREALAAQYSEIANCFT